MNIFYLDSDPKLCAEYLCDKHIVKMPLETAQMLSSAHHIHNSPYRDFLYKQTHTKHKCTLWVASSRDTYLWTYNLFHELCAEYFRRYNKIYASTKLIKYLQHNPVKEQCGFYEPPTAMPEQYQSENVIYSYRKYYIYEKYEFAKWKYSKIPFWFYYIA